MTFFFVAALPFEAEPDAFRVGVGLDLGVGALEEEVQAREERFEVEGLPIVKEGGRG